MVVMDVMVGRPTSDKWLVKTDMVNTEVAQPIGYVTESQGPRQQKRVTPGHQKNKCACQSQDNQGGQEERQSIITLRILMMQAVALREDPDRSVEQPSVNRVLEIAEKKQTQKEYQKHFDEMDIMVSQPLEDQNDTQRDIETEFRPVIRRTP